MNETVRMEGDYGCGETARRRAIRKPHSALKASEINALMQTWRPEPDWYCAWQDGAP